MLNDYAKQRMDELYKNLAYHAHRYYDLDDPEISDFDYDALVRELAELERENPELARENSPTRVVMGAASSKFAKVRHEVPMLSLDNVFNFSELGNFWTRNNNNLNLNNYDYENADYTCEMKIDGAAVTLIYEDGVFVRGATRGDGKIGEDVTENLKAIASLPKKLANSGKSGKSGIIEVRGEVLMMLDKFNELNKIRESQGLSLFANPRNAAAGTLRQLDSGIVAERGIDIFLYYLVNARDLGIERQSGVLEWLCENKLPVQPVWRRCVGFQAVNDFIIEWQDKRFNLNYATDGAVVKLDDLSMWKELGGTSHAPKWAVAYKYPPEEALTKILSIDISVGRTGALTPVANLEPVRLAGTSVRRAGLHNFDEIERMDIRVGDYVRVRKAAEIIPEIISVEKNMRTELVKAFNVPEFCPSCGAKVSRIQGEAVLRCPNRASCPAQLRESIIYFTSRSGMNIAGLGRKLAEQLVEKGLVKNLADIYDLKLDDWAGIERMGIKSAMNLINELEKSKNMPFSSLISGLGIRYAGKRAAEILCSEFNNLDEMINAVNDGSVQNIDGIGTVTASSLKAFFSDDANLELLRRFKAHGLNFNFNNFTPDGLHLTSSTLRRTASKDGLFLQGKTFVFTGELNSMKRDDAAQLVKILGGRVVNSVSSKTSYLVAGADSGSKLKKAEELNIEILSEDEFLSMINYDKKNNIKDKNNNKDEAE